MAETEVATGSSVEVKTEPKSPESDEEVDEKPIPSILDSISKEQIANFQPYYERYFEKKYCTKFTTENVNLDTCVRVHTNKVCVISLSEKHSIIKKHQRIKNLNFQVSLKVNRLKNNMSGKGKRGAQLLQPESVLCFIETEDGEKYPVHAGIYGKLLEINDRLSENPNLLVDDLNEGFLAVILPDLRRLEENIKSLVVKEEYNT
ncbi:protein Abitram [Tribolium castaneum]|uniref:FAM206 family protein CG9288-like Protein n=1 Tax=Tribolium castaneum TaxID=7070 RepID=A0A139WL98_TRICA|nr:PREDICTED: protein Simiate [Tribolium castaneum]KYB28597.1 FAM206 family protein CG9288-like Protein [Tribolium castaneum]|eukprot:XP_008191092.1 PREDICTED: protein Simiate [Tribolium castaneum]